MEEKQKNPALVVGLDNILSCPAWRNNIIPKSWEEYHRDCNKDKPTELMAYINQMVNYCNIIISTERPDSAQKETLHWLKIYAEFIPLEVWMRAELNTADDRGTIKQTHRKNISENYNIIGCVDDDIGVCEDCAQEGIPTIYVTKEEPIGKIVDWVVIWELYHSIIFKTSAEVALDNT